ncbi:hypothetical protein [Paractinoplanes atraurantiacus]|uniref:VOC domain-containing protein n=1 Tax=Paractinoplanes atraurantiacus TaxID=1036182 RepID=A0A285H041_9ACTN|nr:hypothetical protein [Actinoplanes atraurantiacus]SNY29115.1 hypothetical protein SAMN05421748_103194 [Actinoplanes atraurantiacus]
MENSEEVAKIAAEAFKTQGVRVSRVNGSPNDRFAFFNIETPDGQTYRIQIEETW